MRLPPAENGWISGTFWLALADAATDLRALATAVPHVNLMPSHQRRATMWQVEIESGRSIKKSMHRHERLVFNERRELRLAASHEDEQGTHAGERL
jgi:hypothetical protein